jgi:hypothetical protein
MSKASREQQREAIGVARSRNMSLNFLVPLSMYEKSSAIESNPSVLYICSVKLVLVLQLAFTRLSSKVQFGQGHRSHECVRFYRVYHAIRESTRYVWCMDTTKQMIPLKPNDTIMKHLSRYLDINLIWRFTFSATSVAWDCCTDDPFSAKYSPSYLIRPFTQKICSAY